MKKLRIYTIEGWGNYAGGLVVAAATSPEEAAKLGNSQSSRTWDVKFNARDAVELRGISTRYKKPFVVAHFEIGE